MRRDDAIRIDILWRTVQDDLPQLSAVLERIVAAISAKGTRE